MKPKFKKYCCCLLLFFLSTTSFAQDISKTEEKEIYFEIYYVYVAKKDTMIVFLKDAKNLGIQKGASVTAYQSYKSASHGQPEREFKVVGSGRVAVADTLIACFIKLDKGADSLEKGDMVALHINLPQSKINSIFSKLVFNNIYLVNANKKKFYSFPQIFKYDGKQLEDSIFTQMVLDIKDSYDFLKDIKDERLTVVTTL